MEPTKDIYSATNVFDNDTRKELYSSCQKHFDNNLLISDFIDITNSIIDCHGLALSDTSYFPYSERCWNIFCLKIKSHVVEYVKKYGYDGFHVTPFSCWAERGGTKCDNIKSKNDNYDLLDTFLDMGYCDVVHDRPQVVEDHQVKKHFLRSVYNLVSPNNNFGTEVFFEYGSAKVSAEENKLIIYDGTSFKSTHYYPSELYPEKVNIIFDWYINEPFDVPDWILP